MNARFSGNAPGGIRDAFPKLGALRPESGSRKKILVVDESALVRHIAQTFLAGWYDVIAAGSADEAHDKAIAERPDLVLIDFHMPLPELRRDPRTKDIPVVSLIKPLEATALLDTLRAHLGWRIALDGRKTA